MAPLNIPRPDRDRKLRGPIALRGEDRQTSTHDQRLLESAGHADGQWKHEDPWRVMRIQSEFVAGFDALSDLPKAVTVFGSARLGEGTPEYEQAHEVGRALADAGYAVITGGGPGLMEGPNRGAHNAGGHGGVDALERFFRRERGALVVEGVRRAVDNRHDLSERPIHC